jgi:Arc/MetJ-type ribon-helix-helix transcriptional regulator
MAETITLRSDPEIEAHLAAIIDDLKAQGLPASRSSVVRAILHEKLGTEEGVQAVRESLRRITRAVQQATKQVRADLDKLLPEYVEDALNEEDAA